MNINLCLDCKIKNLSSNFARERDHSTSKFLFPKSKMLPGSTSEVGNLLLVLKIFNLMSMHNVGIHS